MMLMDDNAKIEMYYKTNLYDAMFNCNKKDIIFYGVKYINFASLEKSSKELYELIKITDLIFKMVQSLTYKEFFNMFNCKTSYSKMNKIIGKNYKVLIENCNEFNKLKLKRMSIMNEIQMRTLRFSLMYDRLNYNKFEKYKRKTQKITNVPI
jgi:hypothetical protein